MTQTMSHFEQRSLCGWESPFVSTDGLPASSYGSILGRWRLSDGFQFGDRVRVTDGPHDGLTGIFVNRVEGGRCRVIVELSPGRRLIATVGLAEIRKENRE